MYGNRHPSKKEDRPLAVVWDTCYLRQNLRGIILQNKAQNQQCEWFTVGMREQEEQEDCPHSSPAIHPVSNAHHCSHSPQPQWFLRENVMGDNVQSLTEVQADDTCCSALPKVRDLAKTNPDFSLVLSFSDATSACHHHPAVTSASPSDHADSPSPAFVPPPFWKH